MTDAELRTWAEAHAPAGSPLAVGILRVLAEVGEAVCLIRRWRDSDPGSPDERAAAEGLCQWVTGNGWAHVPPPVAMRLGEELESSRNTVGRLAAELADARRVCESLAERCAGQAELIAARAAKDGAA